MSTGTQTEVVMPQMGVSVSEGTITKWLRQAGESIGRDEPLLEISTDKVDTEVPSPAEGVVAQILVPEGETVPVGTVIALIAPAGTDVSATEAQPAEPEPAAAAPAAAAEGPAAPAAAAPEPAPAPPPTPAAPEPAPVATVASEPVGAGAGNGRTFVSPVVARIAAEHGVDPATVPGTGTGGRVTKKDILAFIESGAAAAPPAAPEPAPAAAPEPPPAAVEPAPAVAAEAVAAAPAVAPAAAAPPAAAPPPPPTPTAPAPTPAAAPVPAAAQAEPQLAPGESLEPMTAMRRGVMEHMRRSVDTAAHVTSAIEVDMSRVVALRQKLKSELAGQGVNLTYLAFIARASVETLKDYPWINGEIRGRASSRVRTSTSGSRSRSRKAKA